MTGRRLLSWIFDYLVILGWLIGLFVVVGLPSLLGWMSLDAIWSDRLATDIALTVLTVVPLFVYLVVTEAGPAHATWGKRRTGLEVVGTQGGEPGFGQVAGRNGVKVLPWQLGHMGAVRLAAGETEVLGLLFSLAAMALFALVAGPTMFGIRGLHDLAAGTVVGRRRVRMPPVGRNDCGRPAAVHGPFSE